MLRGQTCYEHEIAFGWFKRPLLAQSGRQQPHHTVPTEKPGRQLLISVLKGFKEMLLSLCLTY